MVPLFAAVNTIPLSEEAPVEVGIEVLPKSV